VKTIALLAVAALPLAACSSGNDRPWIGSADLNGGAVYLDAFREPARPEVSPGSDAPSLESISRTNWQPTVMVSPMEPVAATRTYAVNYLWADATARQRGQMPSAVSSLELSEGSEEDQLWEGVASGPLAMVGAIMIIPRMITHSPTREVRYFPENYWRAPAWTLRKPLGVEAPAESAPPAEPAPQTAPPPPPRTEGPGN
jgi:hypothetical protein